jgi:hypothetical protein
MESLVWGVRGFFALQALQGLAEVESGSRQDKWSARLFYVVVEVMMVVVVVVAVVVVEVLCGGGGGGADITAWD